jgi:two-component system, cell cycle response regulator CpdR
VTVLVVDDEPAIRRVVHRALEREGTEVLEAENGQAALEIIQRDARNIDLVITDLAMPGIGGQAVAQVLSVFRPELPVLAISGHPHMTAPDRRIPLLLKPFTIVELIAAMRLVRSRTRSARAESDEHRLVARQLRAAADGAHARGEALRSKTVDLVAMARLLEPPRGSAGPNAPRRVH